MDPQARRSASRSACRPTISQRNYAPADIEFLFNPDTDWLVVNNSLVSRDLTVLDPPDIGEDEWSTEPIFDRKRHHRARDDFARHFGNKAVVYCRKLTKMEDVGSTWKIVGRKNNSSWGRLYVDLAHNGSAVLTMLAHELGHFLQDQHTFVGCEPLLRPRVKS